MKRNRKGRPFAEDVRVLFDTLEIAGREEAFVSGVHGLREGDALELHPEPECRPGEHITVERRGQRAVVIRENSSSRKLPRREISCRLRVR